MKIYQKLIILLTCLSIIISITFISQTYAKYVTSLSGNASMTISRWNILINNSSVKNNADLTSVITPVFSGNSNIADNILAPTATGYFDLNLDFSATDVSFDYAITISANENNSVPDFIATEYKIDTAIPVAFDSGEPATIEGHVSYDAAPERVTSHLIRVFITWDDSSSATMDNEADTLVTFDEENLALLDVTISFTQTST